MGKHEMRRSRLDEVFDKVRVADKLFMYGTVKMKILVDPDVRFRQWNRTADPFRSRAIFYERSPRKQYVQCVYHQGRVRKFGAQ